MLGPAEIVHAEPLGAVLRKWIVEWLAERPTSQLEREVDLTDAYSSGKQKQVGILLLGPIQFLSMKTGIHIRRVSGICNGEFERVPLAQADALLTAIGKNELLATGEVPIYKNPKWSNERWFEYMRERGCI